MIVCPYVPEMYFRDIMEVCLCEVCSGCTLKADIFAGMDPIDAYNSESEDKKV